MTTSKQKTQTRTGETTLWVRVLVMQAPTLKVGPCVPIIPALWEAYTRLPGLPSHYSGLVVCGCFSCFLIAVTKYLASREESLF